jgi:hypothetical protein
MISAKPSPSASNNTWKCASAEAVTEMPAVRNSAAHKAPAHIVVRNSVAHKAPAHIVVRNNVARKAPAHIVVRNNVDAVVQNVDAVVQNVDAVVQNVDAVVQNVDAVVQNVDAVARSMDAVVRKKGAVVRVAVRVGAVDRLKRASRISGHRELPGGFFRGFGGWLCYQRARWMRRNRN